MKLWSRWARWPRAPPGSFTLKGLLSRWPWSVEIESKHFMLEDEMEGRRVVALRSSSFSWSASLKSSLRRDGGGGVWETEGPLRREELSKRRRAGDPCGLYTASGTKPLEEITCAVLRLYRECGCIRRIVSFLWDRDPRLFYPLFRVDTAKCFSSIVRLLLFKL
jgi:hypothetical protein